FDRSAYDPQERSAAESGDRARWSAIKALDRPTQGPLDLPNQGSEGGPLPPRDRHAIWQAVFVRDARDAAAAVDWVRDQVSSPGRVVRLPPGRRPSGRPSDRGDCLRVR